MPTRKVYGPYKGSKKNKGREIVVIRRSDGSLTSMDAARHKYEKATGRTLPKHVDVDHKNNKRHDNRLSNLKPMSHSRNVAKGNQTRRKKAK